jgi:hypothetical protein
MKPQHDVSDIELDLLFLMYTFSDQFGNVDVESVRAIAYNKLGIILSETPIKINQRVVDALMDKQLIADTRGLFQKLQAPPARGKEARGQDAE